MQLVKQLEETNNPNFDKDDLQVLKAKFTGKKIHEYKPEELRPVIAALIARVGVITGINIPSGKVFDLLAIELQDFITTDEVFSKITYEENIHAFRTFAKGLIGGDKKDYGKIFNIEYYSVIMFSYMRYRANVFIQFEKFETEQKLLKAAPDGHPEQISYYSITESAYQQYLSGKYNPMLWNSNCYDCCVGLNWILPDYHEQFVTEAKSKLIAMKSEEIMEFERKHTKLNGTVYSTKDGLALQLGKLMTTVFDLTKIKDGEPGWLILGYAKNLALEQFFKMNALRGVEFLFVFEPDEPESK